MCVLNCEGLCDPDNGRWTFCIFECVLMSRICTLIHTIANLSQPSLFWYLTICIVYFAVWYYRYVSHIWSWVTLEVQHDTHTTLEMHTLMACLQKYLLTGTSSYLRPRWTWRWLTSEESNWFPPTNSKTQKVSLHHPLLLPGEMNSLQIQCKIDFNTFLLRKPHSRCIKWLITM